MSQDFSAEQKRYLEGFVAGAAASQVVGATAPAAAVPTGPDAPHLLAQDAQVKAGAKLAEPEKWKRDEHPFDAWQRLTAEAATGKLPGPADNFRWRYFGLFNVAPAQDSFMLRMRLPNGILKAHQLAGCARLAETYGGGVLAVTTRANLQMREIRPENAKPLIEELMDLGIVARGSGADNIRNVTGSPLAGIDPQELLDTRPLARDWHFHILNSRVLYGLPRKFNVSFDGAGLSPALEETNDIGFQAVRVPEGGAAEPGIWLRIVLGGISGHRDLARATGAFCRPEEATAIADAIIRVFIDHGDRTNRNRARLKYVLDAWGFDRFLAAVEEKLGRPLVRIAEAEVAPRPPTDRYAHVGVHPQRQQGLNWVGVVMAVGKLTRRQAEGLAAIAVECGDGDVRLTVWQNLILSGVPDGRVAEVEASIAALGLSTTVTPIRAGLVACTGNAGCKFAAADTKRHAMEIAAHVESRVAIDVPVNIHLTGCHHSCAQHYIGDIGLIGARVPVNADGDTVEGYDIAVGGGFAENARIGRTLWKGVKAEDAPRHVEALLRAYLGHRQGPAEGFQAFTIRHDAEALESLVTPHLSPLKEAAE
ncbi:NirA family protein [Phreatobacter cathodiphilus]|uniref:Ferredoxin--nitrite reductase n=1 Tax=Phreatobacter cathodiphilus TaxID=1868589 RepID=A0A2S0N9T5_9HYPH|nr:NirA family protein [Phreatobacter cathodiphilus]AVO44908.1 ferredoxin--nitrite reductase [Phreatobacter cathodiphilus]